MDNIKASPQEIYEVLEQQKKLQDIKSKLLGVLERVNQTINLVTVENLELTSNQIESLDETEEEVDYKPVVENYSDQEKRAEEINQQLIDLELKFSHYDPESDEDLDL